MPPVGGNFSAMLPEGEGAESGSAILPNPITADCTKALQTILPQAAAAEKRVWQSYQTRSQKNDASHSKVFLHVQSIKYLVR